MPMWFKLSLVLLLSYFCVLPYSISIAFIYYNPYLITFIAAFLFVYLYFCLFLISQYKQKDKERNEFYLSLTLKKVVFVMFSLLIVSLMSADTLRFLTPVISDIFASELSIHEFKLVRVEPYAKSFRQLSKLHVVDTKNNEFSFVIKNEMLEQLHLQTNQTFVARGRKCLAGFVIDNINGVDRK
jgi:hypothetical protein